MAAHSFNRSAAVGDLIEREVANLCASFGFNVNPIGNIGSGVPVSYHAEGPVIAPDLIVSKPREFSHLALEVKGKEPVRGDYWIDEKRLRYALEWSQHNHMPLLYVFKAKPYEQTNPHSFRCASVAKLEGNHHTRDASKKDRNGRPEPVLMFDPDLFTPFTDFLEHGREVVSVEYRVELEGEEVRV